jgi:hypothetical protein
MPLAVDERRDALSRLYRRHLVLQALSPTTGSLNRGVDGSAAAPILVRASAVESHTAFSNLPAETSTGNVRRIPRRILGRTCYDPVTLHPLDVTTRLRP